VGLTLKLYGGIEGEVGGNQILVQSDKTALLLDLGVNFSRWRKFFVFPTLMPREPSDYFRVGLVHEDLREPGTDWIRADVRACFISHAHTDHYEAICTLRPGEEGPDLYLGETTSLLLRARYERMRKSPLVERVRALLEQNVRTFRTGARIEVGDITVLPWHVDHSVPGAYAFILDTPDGLMIYTGDFRLHGSFTSELKAKGEVPFWQVAREMASKAGGVRALICEGTNVGETANPLTEEDVAELLRRCMRACEGLIIVNTSTYDVDRLRTLRDVASEAGRTLVAPESFLYALQALKNDDKLRDKLPEVGVDILNFSEAKEDVRARQSEFILLTAFFREREIIEVQPEPGSYFVLSSSEPFEEESEIEFERLQNWLELFGVPIYHIHSSGHASPIHIRRIVKTIKPKKIFPIHTSNPQAFGRSILDILKEDRIEFIAPERGIAYPI